MFIVHALSVAFAMFWEILWVSFAKTLPGVFGPNRHRPLNLIGR
jgi:hypothetical protein